MAERSHSEEQASLQGSASLMREESVDQGLFVSEYSYSDEDTQQERRRSLEKHSSTDVTDIPIVAIIDNQLTQSENETNKPIVSYVQSFFRSSASSTNTPNVSWLSGPNSRKDPRRLNLENLMKITEPSEAIEVLNRAVELKTAMYTQAALDLITHLCEQDKSKRMSASLGAEGACNVVETLLGMSLSSAALTEAALRAICSLITPVSPAHESPSTILPNNSICAGSAESGVSSNRRRFSSAGSVYQIIKAAGSHVRDEIVLEWGLRVIFYLSLESGIVSRVISCGGVDLLSQALRTHTACDDINIWCCRTLCNCILTLDAISPEDRTVCQNKFSQQLVLEILISQFIERINSIVTLSAQWTLKAIGCLARRHEHNTLTFVELGICELMPSIVRQFKLENEKIAESICWVIGNISYPSEEAQSRWGACGACEIVLNTLRRHVGSEETVQEALRAVRNLCYDHDGNLELLLGLNVAETVMSVIKRHQESSGVVLQWLWYAVAALAEYRPLVLQLGEQDVCGAAVASLVKFSTHADLVQWTALAVAKLATELKLSVTLGQADCCAVLVLVLTEHLGDEDVVEEIFSAINALCSNSMENRAHFHAAHCESIMLKAVARHEKSESVVEAGLGAVASMVQVNVEVGSPTGSDESGSVASLAQHTLDHHSLLGPAHSTTSIVEQIVLELVKHDGCKVVSRALHRHAAIQEIALYGSKCISDIALYGFYSEIRATSEAVKGLDLPLRSPNHNNVSNITSRTHTTQYSNSTKYEDVVLVPLGQSSAPVALYSVLHNFTSDVSIVQYALLALDRIASCSRNLSTLHSAGVDVLLITILQTHYMYDHTIVNLCYRLITHFSVLDESRDNIGKHNGTEVVLIAMAHNMHDTLPAKLGADAVSGLCLSPQYDAIAVMCSKDEVGPSYDELEVTQSYARRLSVEGSSATGPKPRSRSSTSEDLAAAITEAQTNRTLSSLFSWGSSNSGNSTGTGSGNSRYASASTTATTTASGGGKTLHVPKAISTFELMSKKGANNATTPTTLTTLHGAFISKGLTDREEELHQAKMLARNRKSNTSVLVGSGITTILLTLLDKHVNSYEVQISAVNALNSIALDPEYRSELNKEGIYGALVKAYRACLYGTSSGTSTGGSSDVVDTDLTASTDALSIDINSTKHTTTATNTTDIYTDQPARRALLIILNIAIGTLCLPLVEEVEGVNRNDNLFATANQNVLGQLGVCELVVECLKNNAKDTLVSEAALRALYYLSRNHTTNQTLLMSAIPLVIHALRTLFYKPNIVYYACLCIAGLSFRHTDNCTALDQCDVGNIIVKVLNIYIEQPEVVEAACYAVYALKLLNHRLAEACQLVVDALLTHAESGSVNQYAMQAIGSLSELRSNKVLLDKYNVCAVVTAALQRYVSSGNMLSAVFLRDTSNAAVAQWGCTAIYYIARGADSVDYQQKLVSAGACEAVTKALLKYSEYETIAHACFRSLVVLLMNNVAYKSKLGAMGVCGCVVEAMHSFPYSAQVAKWGCRAVAVLAESHEANIARLGVAGACESIPVILQAHPTSEYVASAGCDVISFMSEVITNGFAARFGQAGGCEAVVSVLRTHTANPHVVTRASIAIASLSRVKGNATWMGPAGACDALMYVLQAHYTDLSVAKFIISAMGNLCIIDNNRERLGVLGACEIVVSCAQMHLHDVDTGKAAGLCMGKLCEAVRSVYSTSDTDSPHSQDGGSDSTLDLINSKHHALSIIVDDSTVYGGSAGVGGGNNTSNTGSSTKDYTPDTRRASLSNASPSHSTSDSSLPAAPNTTTNTNNTTNTTSSTNDGRISPVPTRPTTTTLSAPALVHANAGRRNRARLYDANYCTTLIDLLQHHITDADTVRIIARTISIIAFGDACSAERDALYNVGACKFLAQSMQYHEGNESIGRGVCWAIKALSYHHPNNREALRVHNICPAILVVLRAYRYSKNATETVQGAAAAIANLCQDSVLCKSSMGVAGACEGLLEVMELHHRNIEVAYLCSKALFHVVDGNHENNLKISFSGAADILMAMITRYTDEERILDYIFSIMISMCTGKVGQSRLGTVGVSKSVVSALYRYEKSSEYMVLLCCTLIQSLALNSSDNQNKLGAAGACKAIASIAARYVRSNTFYATNMKIMYNNGSGKSSAVASTTPTNASSSADTTSTTNTDTNTSTTSNDMTPYTDYPATTNTTLNTTTITTSAPQPKDPLCDIIGELSVLKECCKAVVYLSSRNTDNRAKLQNSTLLDTLTPVLSSAVPYRMFNGPSSVSGNISTETLNWVKSAVDVLMGKQ